MNIFENVAGKMSLTNKGYIVKVGGFDSAGIPDGWRITGASLGLYYKTVDAEPIVGGYTFKELREIVGAYNEYILECEK